MLDSFKELFERELNKLEDEINAFRDEATLWKISGDIKNSAGNLCLHVCGNLQHFIGQNLGQTGYSRDRDAEFSRKDVPKDLLIMEIHQTKDAVQSTFNKLSDTDLQKIYRQNILAKDVTTGYFFIFLLAHFNYHLGQINYARRIFST